MGRRVAFDPVNEIAIPAGTRPTSDRMAILLCELQAATSVSDDRRRGHWINVASQLWREILGRNYAEVIEEAKSLEFVETNDRYSVGRFTKSIRLASKFRTHVTSQYRLQRRLRGGRSYRIRLANEDSTGHALASCFDRATIPKTVSAKGWDSYCIQSIESRSFYAVRCQYGRFHSLFTSLPKSVRSSIQIDGRETIETDVANCQPLILGILSTQHNNTPTTTHTQPPTTPNTICGAFHPLGGYLSLCSGGQLYDYLLDRCGDLTLWDTKPVGFRYKYATNRKFRHEYATNRKLNRSDVKKQFIVMLFAPIWSMRRMPIFDIVANEFPPLAEYIICAKSDEYQELARLCQRMESKLIIDNVAKELVTKLPIVTIHDSVISQAEHADRVAASIRAAFHPFGVTIKQA